jgi:hypothetical protein
MRINHPRPELGRQHDLGVDFTDGVAIVESLHPERELALRQHGFTIEADLDVEAPFQEALGEPIIDLTSLTKAELRALLPEDAEVPKRVNHADLVALVAALPAEPIPGATQNEDGSWTIEGVPIPEGQELTGPFGTFTRLDGTVVGDGNSLVTLGAADEAPDFED